MDITSSDNCNYSIGKAAFFDQAIVKKGFVVHRNVTCDFPVYCVSVVALYVNLSSARVAFV